MTGNLFETTEERAEDRAVAHAYGVLRGEVGGSAQTIGLKPTAQMIALLRILADRRGAGRAIQISSLAATLRSTPREIKSDVRDLRMLFGVRIGSSRDQQAGGYYLITSKAELMATVTPMLHQLRSEAAVIRSMCEPHELAELEGQLRLTAAPEDAHAA